MEIKCLFLLLFAQLLIIYLFHRALSHLTKLKTLVKDGKALRSRSHHGSYIRDGDVDEYLWCGDGDLLCNRT
jgi:hypothetical protein